MTTNLGGNRDTVPEIPLYSSGNREQLPASRSLCKIGFMERDDVIAALKAHEQELRTAGVLGLSLFGSVARGEDSTHDVDVAVRLGENFSAPGLSYFSRLSELEGRLSGILGCRVDVIEEPVRKKRFQEEIDRDRTLAF